MSNSRNDKVTDRVDAFLNNVSKIIKDRGNAHKDSHHVAETTAKIMSLIRPDEPTWTAGDYYDFMIAFKLARITNDVSIDDSLSDLVGYAFLRKDWTDAQK